MRAQALAALVLVATVVGSLGSPDAGWRAKADAPLLAAFDAGQPELTVLVQGPAPAKAADLPDRAAWKAHWAAASQPFLGAVRSRAQALGGTVGLEVPAIDAAFVRVGRAALPELLALPGVRSAGLDAMGAVRPLPGDGGPSPQLRTEDAIAHLQAQDVWNLGFRGEAVKVAIVDTGILPTHEVARRADGSSRIVAWHDATGPAGHCDSPCDTQGHGTSTTHAAAGGNAYNPSAPRGVAPRADLVGVRIFQGGGGTWEDAQEGLQAAFDLGAEVAAAPWGGSCDGAGGATAELAEALGDAGMPVVAAAGGSGPGPGTVNCPGRADRVITGGGVDADENIHSPSGRGPCTWHNVTRVCPDLVAVVVSLELANAGCDTCYSTMSGTSWSTAQLAGAVALLHQVSKAVQGRGLNHSMEAELLMRFTARDLGPSGPDNSYGSGIAQLRAAHDVLVGNQTFYLRDAFDIERAVTRAYQGNALSFVLTSFGTAPLSGHLIFEVDQQDTGACPPTCDHLTIADQDLAMTRFSQAVFAHNFSGADHPAGAYLVHARYDYSYIDPDGGLRTGTIERAGSFVLKKVTWAKARDVPTSTPVGTVTLGAVSLENVGNDDALALNFTDTFDAHGHAPLPALPPGVGQWGLFANPAPSAVRTDSNLVTTYAWDVGTVEPGSRFDALYNFLAAQPGPWTFRGELVYTDTSGFAFTERFDQPATVTLV